MLRSILPVLATMLYTLSYGQEKWDLRKCVEYAMTNNINIRQSDIQAKLAELSYKETKMGRWPSLNFSTSLGEQFGRSIDPATNQFSNNQIFFNSLGLNTTATLFNWFSVKNAIAASELEWKASQAGVEKLKNDISLNVAAAYLQALLSREQIRISEVQVKQTLEQLANTRKLVDAGSLPELNAAELEAQLARDSSTLISSRASYQSNLLGLRLWMNYDPALPFELDTPSVEKIPIDPLTELQPEYVYQLAIKNLPQQRVNDLRLQSLEKMVKSARGQMYPTLSFFAGVQSSYSSALERLPSGTPVSVNVPIGTVDISGNTYQVFTQTTVPPDFKKANWFRQLDFQQRQNIGLQLTVPIFQGYRARYNWERSKINVTNQKLTLERDARQLKQDIYSAYNSAMAAFQRYQASKKTVQTADYSYELSRKRYEAGLLRTIDLITNQNNLFSARVQLLINQFDYVFQMKVLEFYKGEGLKL